MDVFRRDDDQLEKDFYIRDSDGAIATKEEKKKFTSKDLAIFKVYLTLGIMLLATGLISALYTYGFARYLTPLGDIVFTVVAIVLYIVGSLIVAFKTRNNRGIASYAGGSMVVVAFGIILSPIVRLLNVPQFAESIMIAFFSSAALMFAMALFAKFVKTFRVITFVMLGLAAIALILSFVNLIYFFSTIYNQPATIDIEIYFYTSIAIEAVMLLYFLLATVVDFASMDQLAKNRAFDNNMNLTIYFGVKLYIDFILLFMRLVIILLAVAARRD